MNRWKVFSIVVVLVSLAAFLFFAYTGSVAGVPCGSISGTAACSVRAIMGGVDAFTDYMYAVISLLLGQIVLLSALLLRKSH